MNLQKVKALQFHSSNLHQLLGIGDLLNVYGWSVLPNLSSHEIKCFRSLLLLGEIKYLHSRRFMTKFIWA